MGFRKMIVDDKAVIAFIPRLGEVPAYLREYVGLRGISFKDATRDEYDRLKRKPGAKVIDTGSLQIKLI